MPMKSVRVCSFCEFPSTKFHEYTLTNQKAESTLHYELCEGCDKSAYMVELRAFGEKRKESPAAATRPVVKTRASSPAKPTAKKTTAKRKPKLVKNENGEWLCPDCDFKQAHAAAVGRHFSTTHA